MFWWFVKLISIQSFLPLVNLKNSFTKLNLWQTGSVKPKKVFCLIFFKKINSSSSSLFRNYNKTIILLLLTVLRQLNRLLIPTLTCTRLAVNFYYLLRQTSQILQHFLITHICLVLLFLYICRLFFPLVLLLLCSILVPASPFFHSYFVFPSSSSLIPSICLL